MLCPQVFSKNKMHNNMTEYMHNCIEFVIEWAKAEAQIFVNAIENSHVKL